MSSMSLKEAERRAFRASHQDGLWDVLIGCVALMLAVAPPLSRAGLGDFWSAAVFVPVWVGIWTMVWLLKRNVVAPRAGVVEFGPVRKAKLTRLAVVALVVNVVMLVLGFLGVTYARPGSGLPIEMAWLVVLAGFSLAAYFLERPILFVYGLLFLGAAWVGEWLYRVHDVPHHGFPVTFGIAAVAIITSALVQFARFLRQNPPLKVGEAGEDA